MTVTQRRLAQLVREDKQIAKQAESATLALMEHRHKAVAEVQAGITADNPRKRTGGVSAYAKALGVSQSTVSKYVLGWKIWQEAADRGTAMRPDEALERGNMGEQKQAAVEAVAEAKGISVQQARKQHAPDVDHVLKIIRNEPGDDAVDKGRRVAHNIEAVRQAEKVDRDKRKASTPAAFLELESFIRHARRDLDGALTVARTAELDDDYIALLVSALNNAKAVLELIKVALSGVGSVDWDAELQKLEASQ